MCGYLVVAGSVHKELMARDLAYIFYFHLLFYGFFTVLVPFNDRIFCK